jgi:2-polyprenyl-6-methoxyphenol hydroxylase-like FAD-dependent oxidoreductase
MRGKSAAVVGGGIGGLAAGNALGRAGLEVTVYERAEEIRPLGAGLSIWPNGVNALRDLGMDALVDAAGVSLGGGALRRADGTSLADFDPSLLVERYGQPLVGLDRGALHMALIEGLGRRLVLGAEVQSPAEGVLSLPDGSEVRPDLIVGADGLHSAIRMAILEDGDPVDSGIVAYRGISAWNWPVPDGEWWASKSIAGLLPLPGNKVYWYLAHRGEPDSQAIPGLLGEYSEPLPEVVAATPAGEVLCHRLLDRDPVTSWSRGAMTLLGDAAHPMLPFLGQGACAALEDAVALGRAVEGADGILEAIDAYEAKRVSRTADLVNGSRRAAKVALLSSRAGRRIRNALVSHVPARARLRQLDRVISLEAARALPESPRVEAGLGDAKSPRPGGS